MIMKTPTKVWPLTHSVPGYTAHGDPIILQPGMPGWMDGDDAKQAEAEGKVDIMAGKTPQSLRKPCYETRVVTATPEPEPVAADRPEEEPPLNAEEEETPKPKTTKKTMPRPGAPRRKYRRTDMKAEN